MARITRPRIYGKSLSPKEISPQSIKDNARSLELVGSDAIALPLVMAAKRPVLLMGATSLREHLAHSGGSLIQVIELAEVSSADQRSLQRLDRLPHPSHSEIMHAVAAASRGGMNQAQIADYLPHVTHQSTASLYAVLALASPLLIEQLDEGVLTLGHVRKLVGLSHDAQERHVRTIVSKHHTQDRISISKLVELIKGPKRPNPPAQHAAAAPPDPPSGDLSGTLGALNMNLKTDVRIDFDAKTKRSKVHIDWTTAQDLIGIFQAIGNAPPPPMDHSLNKNVLRRTLTLDLDLDEFDQAFHHLSNDPFSF